MEKIVLEDDAMRRLSRALTYPIVLRDPSWTIPNSLVAQILVERIEWHRCGREDDSVTDAEILAYLSNASLVMKLPQAYCLIFARFFRQFAVSRGYMISKAPAEDTPSPPEQRALADLRKWIASQRLAGK